MSRRFKAIFWTAIIWFCVGLFTGWVAFNLIPKTLEEPSEEVQVDSVAVPQVDTVAEITSILAGGRDVEDHSEFFTIAQTIHGTAYWFDDVDPFMVARLVYTESRGDSLAISRVGAVGLGQIRPNIWQGVFPECGNDLRKVRDNICYTVNILHYYQKRSPTQEIALLSYNGCKSDHCRWYPRAIIDDAAD